MLEFRKRLVVKWRGLQIYLVAACFAALSALAEPIPQQAADALASVPQIEALMTDSLCNQPSIQQQWGLDQVSCMSELFEEGAVSWCTTQHLDQVPRRDNVAEGTRLNMADFSAVYMQCLVARHGQGAG